MRNPKCGICRNRLNDDGTCRFASSHQNILNMRVEQGRGQSERARGRVSSTPRRSREDYQEMARKSNEVQRSTAAPKREKNPKRSAAGKRNAAGKPRDKGGRFRRKNGK